MASMELDGGIKIYLREIGKTDLLTPAQEVQLADRIKGGIAAVQLRAQHLRDFREAHHHACALRNDARATSRSLNGYRTPRIS